MANVPINRRWWPKLAEAAVHPAVEQAVRQAYNAIYDSQDAIDILATKHATTTTTVNNITAGLSTKREDYSGANWGVSWFVFNANFCVGTGYCVEGSTITLATGFPLGNMVWAIGPRTVYGFLQGSGDAILSMEFLIPNGTNTCTSCRYMKSNDGDTWRTNNITAQFVGFGYK